MSQLRKLLRGRKTRRYGSRVAPGARPGSIAIHPDARPSQIRITCYGPDDLVDFENCEVEEIADHLGKQPVTWVDIVGLGSREVFEPVGKIFGLHPLALSDVAHVPQRPKVEDYRNHLFLVAHVPNSEQGELSQISFFVGKNFVLTWQEYPGKEFQAVRNRLQIAGRSIRESGSDYLLYTLLDAVIDSYFPVLSQLGDQLDDLDEQVFENVSSSVISEMHALRHQVRHLRSIMWPQREAVSNLIGSYGWLISSEVAVHLRDCHDHTFQIIDTLENFRESCSDLRDYYATEVSNRMNQVMKVLTIIATIFIPMSFVTGLYGMNFDTEVSPYNMPELKSRWGYPIVVAVLAMMAAGQLLFFGWKGWLSSFGRNGKSKR